MHMLRSTPTLHPVTVLTLTPCQHIDVCSEVVSFWPGGPRRPHVLLVALCSSKTNLLMRSSKDTPRLISLKVTHATTVVSACAMLASQVKKGHPRERAAAAVQAHPPAAALPWQHGCAGGGLPAHAVTQGVPGTLPHLQVSVHTAVMAILYTSFDLHLPWSAVVGC